jgi:aspartate/methionine/tyrosine aminotransferase
MAHFAQRIGRLGTENAFKVGPHIANLEKQGHHVVRLNLGEPDFNIPDWVRDEVKRQLDLGNTHYCDPKGVLSLRQAIAHQIEETRGLTIDPERVVVFPGLKPALGLCQEVYCDPGDEVIYPTPGFPIYESFVRFIGAIPKPLQLREEANFTFTAADLAGLITPKTRLIYLNFPSNPTGGVASRELLESIAKVVQERCSPNVRIFSDEIYEYILFDGHAHNSIASIKGMEERTIIGSGFSKTFAWTGGRVGYAIFPTIEEANVMKNMNINLFSCTPPFIQEGARIAYTHPSSRAHILEMVETFQKRRDTIVAQLNLIEGVHCKSPSGAFYLFPNISGACQQLGAVDAYEKLPAQIKRMTSPATLVQMFALYYHQVAVMDRRSFGTLNSEGQHYLRLSIASELSELEEGVRRLAAAFNDQKGFRTYCQAGENFC